MANWFELLTNTYKTATSESQIKKDSTAAKAPAFIPLVKAPQITVPNIEPTQTIFNTAVKPDMAGTSIEKTTPTVATTTNATASATTSTNAATKPIEKKEEAKASDDKSKTPTKSKRTIDEAMRASYPNWDKMTKEEREKKIVAHLTSIDKEEFNYLATKNQPDGRIGWLKSFLLNDKMTEEESKTVVGALKNLNVSKEEFAELQAQGVKMAFDGDNENKESCQLQVAEDITAYGVKAQKVAVEKTSTSEFDSVKLKGSEQVSGLDTTIQTDAAKQYMEGSKTSSKEIQKQIGVKLIDQYAKYAKENQVDIHKIMAYSDLAETRKYAAENIWHFDAKNQSSAFNVTMEQGDKEAVNAATSNFSKYADEAKPAISDAVYNSDYKEAQKILEDNGVTKDTYSKEQIEESKKFSSSSENAKEVQTKLENAIKSNDKGTILEIFTKKGGNLNTVPKGNLTVVLKILLANNPSGETLSKIMGLLGELKGQDKQDILDMLGNNDYFKNVLSKQGNLDENTQIAIIRKNGNLDGINERLLSADARKLLNEKMGATHVATPGLLAKDTPIDVKKMGNRKR